MSMKSMYMGRYNVMGLHIQTVHDDLMFHKFSERFLARFRVGGEIGRPDLKVSFASRPREKPQVGELVVLGATERMEGNVFSCCAHESSEIFIAIETSEEGHQNVHCYRLGPSIRSVIRFLRAPKKSRNQLWMTMIRQAVLVPAFAKLMVGNGIGVVHASVVSKNSLAAVFSGLNGCGKSGLALHMLLDHGYSFMSDNYALLQPDSLTVVSVPEPLRLAAHEGGRAAEFLDCQDEVFGKRLNVVAAERIDGRAKIAFMAYLSIGPEFNVVRMSAQHFVANLLAIHRSLGETPENNWIQLYYQLALRTDLYALAWDAVSQMCERLPCYSVQLPQGAGTWERYHEVVAWTEGVMGGPTITEESA